MLLPERESGALSCQTGRLLENGSIRKPMNVFMGLSSQARVSCGWQNALRFEKSPQFAGQAAVIDDLAKWPCLSRRVGAAQGRTLVYSRSAG